MNTVRYIARVEPFRDMEIVLFHVFNSVPEGYWDLEKDPRSTATVRQVKAWEIEQKKRIKQYMEQAGRFLIKAGFTTESITTKIKNRKKGIARDIIHEARNGYDAVVTRRRGMTTLRRVVLGSVATKLIAKLTFLPLILVGKQTPNNKILLAFDGSDNAERAVNFVGSLSGGLDYEVSLFNALRSNGESLVEYQHILSPKEYSKFARKEMASSLKAARTELINAGFKANKVSTQIVTKAISRAGAIADRAKQENFGTIVMGRRGHSSVRDFFIGRVTNKVIQIARDRTIWVIR
ncbi:MAG: universal stress protein [Deltaproteobacteria bacterium]|nr:universal stress protein [Deltaproteobacteria bacterium]